MLFEELHHLSIQELDDLYYRLHDQGKSLVHLRSIRAVQESKLRKIPVLERQQWVQQIQDRYTTTMLDHSAKRMLKDQRA